MMAICSGIETEYPIYQPRGDVLYVVTAECSDGSSYDYKSYNPEWALTAQQGYEYRKGHVAVMERIPQ